MWRGDLSYIQIFDCVGWPAPLTPELFKGLLYFAMCFIITPRSRYMAVTYYFLTSVQYSTLKDVP